jgi:hypothetical protein
LYYYSSNLKLSLGIGGIWDIYNPNTSISKIIDLIRPVDKWEEIAFSDRQNAQNEHCETLKIQVHELDSHHLTFLYKALNVVYVY